MEYATLNNGIKMPMAGIGTFLLTPDEAEASVLSALQCGYRLIDTANAYVNEKAVGRAMRKSGIPRDEIFLETKLWPSFYEQEDAVEKTLQRLGTDYIDLLLIHQPAGNYVAGYRLMEKAYKEGKVRAIGLSNFTPEQVQEILDICEVKPAVLQTEVHPYSQEKELKAFLDKEGIVIQAWYPLGHGDKALIQEPLFTEFGKKYGKSNAQIILRWHIQAGNIVIPGSKNPAHIKDNFNLFDFALTDDEMAKITALDKQKRYYTSTPEMLKTSRNKEGFAMRKNFGTKSWFYPLPVLVIGTYDENGNPDAMNAAWGGLYDADKVVLCLSAGHKTTRNIQAKGAFTVSFADAAHAVSADYVGMVSANNEPKKMEKSGFHCTKSESVDAPLIDELPVALECKLLKVSEDGNIIGQIVNVSIDESVLDRDGKLDMSKFQPISFEPANNGYHVLGERVGNAFSDGGKLK